MDWDVFVSHASEDKDFVRILVAALQEVGLRVWFDEMQLNVGDSLRRSIDQGLSKSEYGIVVLSNSFFAKEWPQKELDGLVAREDGREKVILPIWHNVTADEVRRFSPSLADKLSIYSTMTMDMLVEKILRAIHHGRIISKGWLPPTMMLPDYTQLVLLPIQPREGVALGLSKHPITNGQYQRFLAETKHPNPVGERFRDGVWQGPFEPMADSEFNQPTQPVVCVSFEDAVAYCRWVNKAIDRHAADAAEARAWGNWAFLPTTQLWDFAAWGGRQSDQRAAEYIFSEQQEIHHKASSPAAIDESGSRANARGIHDMFGNVWEWCSDYFFGSGISVLGVFNKRAEVEVRGGSFLDDLHRIRPHLRASILKDGTGTRHSDLGFRVAAIVPVAYLPKDVAVRLDLQPRFSSEFWHSCIAALRYPFYDGDGK